MARLSSPREYNDIELYAELMTALYSQRPRFMPYLRKERQHRPFRCSIHRTRLTERRYPPSQMGLRFLKLQQNQFVMHESFGSLFFILGLRTFETERTGFAAAKTNTHMYFYNSHSFIHIEIIMHCDFFRSGTIGQILFQD